MTNFVTCCKHTRRHKKCIRKHDNKIFTLPRKFTRNKCRHPKGYTMKSSCAPYKFCKQSKKIRKKIEKKKGKHYGIEN